MTGRDLDIVIFGATGYIGRLTAAYLAKHAPEGTRIALAGRSRRKLEKTRAALPAGASTWPLVVADADVPESLEAMVRRTRVVATTVGPYLKYGEAVVAAAAEAGTDYIDLTGEVPFVRWSIDRVDEIARASGARIVHACGFDSIPSDIGVYALHQQVIEDGAGELTSTTSVVTRIRGGASGGTIDSMRVIASLGRDPRERRLLLNPRALSSGPGTVPAARRTDEASDLPVMRAATVDASLRGILGPFFMSSFNTRIVRRTHHLLEDGYGQHFRYGEAMAFGRNRALSWVAATTVAVGFAVFLAALAFKPTRAVLDLLLPKPGDGPSEKAREAGYFELKAYTTTTHGDRYVATTAADGDPGYKATAMMFGEAALTLALDRSQLPDQCGVLTPAAAMGNPLINRLRAAGMTIRATRLSAGPTRHD